MTTINVPTTYLEQAMCNAPALFDRTQYRKTLPTDTDQLNIIDIEMRHTATVQNDQIQAFLALYTVAVALAMTPQYRSYIQECDPATTFMDHACELVREEIRELVQLVHEHRITKLKLAVIACEAIDRAITSPVKF